MSSSSSLFYKGSNEHLQPPSLKKTLQEINLASASLGQSNSNSYSHWNHPNAPSTTTHTHTKTGTGMASSSSSSTPLITVNPTSSLSYAEEASAHRLLSARGIDSTALSRTARDLEVRSRSHSRSHHPFLNISPHPGDAAMTLEDGNKTTVPQSLFVYLQQSHANLIQEVLSHQRMVTRQRCEEQVEQNINRDWEERRRVLLQSVVGGRTLGGSHANLNNANKNGNGNPSSVNGTSLALVSTDGGEDEAFRSSAMAHLALLRSNTGIHLDNLLSLLHREESKDRAYMNATQLLHTMVMMTTSHHTLGIHGTGTGTGTNGNHNRNDNPESDAQLTTLRARATLVFLGNQFRDHLVKTAKRAALLHTTATTQSGRATGSGSLSADVTRFVEMELGRSVVHGSTISSPDSNHTPDPDVLWRCLYYCLRCGDACAALDMIQGTNASNLVDPAIVQILLRLAREQQQQQPSPSQQQGDSSSVSHTQSIFHISNLDTIIPPTFRIQVEELYHQAKTKRHSPTTPTTTPTTNAPAGDYQLACLALLSLAEPLTSPNTTTATSVIQTIEDYLFASLWDAVLSNENHSDSTSLTSNDNSNDSSCAAKVAQLGKLIQHWGPSYFDTHTSRHDHNDTLHPHTLGWAYAMPLLMTLQFQSALTHLGNVGGLQGLCIATHLGLAMFHSGIAVTDWHEIPNNNSSDGNPTPPTTGTSRNTRDSSNNNLLAQLISAYASTLQDSSPDAALEYLVCIPDSDTHNPTPPTHSNTSTTKTVGTLAQKHIRQLLLTTKAFETLAGHVAPDGSRNISGGGGALDQHLTPSQVSNLLALAAEETLREGNVADAAELLALAGRYSALLSLLNRKLASLLFLDNYEEYGKEHKKDEDASPNQAKWNQREFWRNAALRFHSLHLSQGRSHVLHVLEKDGNTSLGLAFQMLLNLMVFFDRCHEREWQSAWKLIDSLELFPKSDSEISAKIESFHCLDVEIKPVFHHVIMSSMESLYQQHVALKSNPHVGGGGGGMDRNPSAANAIQQRLGELRVRARLLVTFAGLIHLNYSGEIKSRIARLEAYMV